MSFTADVKKELTTLEPEKKCCQLAEIALYLRLSGTITLRGGVGIRSTTNNPAVARFYASLIKEYFGIKTSLEVTEGNSLSKGRSYGLYIGPEMNSDGVLRESDRILLSAEGPVRGLNIPIGRWHSINVLEPTVILECKDGKYEPLSLEDVVEG